MIENIVLEALKIGADTSDQLHQLKIKYAKQYQKNPPKNSEIIAAYRNLLKKRKICENRKFERLIRKRNIRTLSGVSPVAVLTKSFGCPGQCIYCPAEKNVPKSYLSNEPAVMRAIIHNYDAYEQVKWRVKALDANGHPTDKIELIIMGGTWSSLPKVYQNSFIKGCFDGLNLRNSQSLKQAQKKNESAKHRCVALTLETRPDWINEKEIIRMRELGATRIEIGVQSLYDDVLNLVKRGHKTDATIRATQLLKDAGFKISYHMMPNLPGSNVARDIKMFKELFENPEFKPDMLKVYPCVVAPFSELEKWYKQGRYKPYTDKQLIKIILAIKKYFPRYLRVSRLYRDIPSQSIIAGSKVSNMRQVVHELMKEKGICCSCIRCREIRGQKINLQNIEFKIMNYSASNGQEFFLSFNDTQSRRLCALLRLRFSSYSLKGKKHFIKELEGAALIRELHTYGSQVPLSEKDELATQHMGFGKRLVSEAEKIATKNGYKKITTIAGIGVRQYYKKLRYELDGTYMVKKL
ncbi:tRNA uridine(34) 5-carboxymethylaminomethyl modification radical SAM/GNAT enzyme Elp3 [Candidatus Peregrinibacteria bacterium]|nr:tRNA uridine(34) 5-carboxymethylaminomethyl modification radical SAM/GNAT enzyme Elp3 [Candidatus Peregrinibacteria bacterium]